MTPKLKKIILTIIILGILFVLYAIFIKPDPSADVLVSGKSGSIALSSQEARLLGSQISQALLKIEQITLTRSIFENPVFNSLQDRSQPIIEEPVGRTNPFAPLGDTSVNVSTTRTSLNMASSSDSAAPAPVTATTTQNSSTSSPTL